ncbi:MAG: PAS domain S-box protein [Vicinamibacterales bacterium]
MAVLFSTERDVEPAAKDRMHEGSARSGFDVPTGNVQAHDTFAGLRATIDLAPIGLAQFDLEGRFLHVNDRLCEILGCGRPDLLARTFQEITFPDDLPRCLELTTKLAANEFPQYRVEKRFVRPDGSVVWTRITVSAVRGADSTPAFFIGAAEDISEQVIASQALRTAEERLRTALDASGIGTFRFDVRRNALDWADGLERVFGGRENATLEQFFEVMHPDDRPQMMAAYTRSVTEGADFEEEFRALWPDGSWHWLHDRGRTYCGTDGTPLYILGAITDISNHKRMEEVISNREAQFRTLANTIPQLAWIANNDGSRSWFNDRWFEFTGYGIEESQGLGWMRVHASDAAGVLTGQLNAFRAGSTWEDTVRLRRRDGEYRWFLSRAMPVRTPDGTITQWFGTNTDITDREEILRREQASRNEAERATAVRQQVLGFVAHDLRSPLHAIVMAAAALDGLQLPAEQRTRQIELIKRCARDMDRLIADLLDASRMQAGTFAVRREPVAVPELLADVIERFQEHARSRDVQLVSEVEPNSRPIDGDGQRLAQAVSNLLNNAIRFTPAGGRVLLGARQSATHLDILVQDTGCGIATEDLALIFDRFWQADRTSAGAGLGLVIVKGIIESHEGQIHVESVPDRGTTFRVRLPCSRGMDPGN